MTTKNRQVSIITGGGRCGTHFFGKHLSDIIENCYSVHEPDILHPGDPELFAKIRCFGWYQTVFGKLIRRRGLRMLSIQAYQQSLPENEIVRRLRAQRTRFFSSIKENTIVEANAAWWGVTQYANRIDPHIRIVVIIRHPVTWISSWLQHGGLHDRRDIVGALGLGRLNRSSWRTQEPWVRLAHNWAELYGHLHKCCKAHRNHRMFRFEDLFGDTRSQFDEMLTFVSGDRPDYIDWRRAESLSSRPTNVSRKSITTRRIFDADIIKKICGPLAQSYGYEFNSG